jgi:hypothetical protein
VCLSPVFRLKSFTCWFLHWAHYLVPSLDLNMCSSVGFASWFCLLIPSLAYFPGSFLRFECVFLYWLCFLVPSLGLLCGQLPSSQFWLYIFVFHSLVRLNFSALSLGLLLLFLRRDYFTVTLSYRFWFLY